MKKLAVLTVLLAGALALAPAAPAQEDEPQVRVINLDAYGSTSLSDSDLAELAEMDMSKDATLFPPSDDFVVTIEPCPTGTPGGEPGDFLVNPNFVSVNAITKEVLPYRFAAVGDTTVGSYSVVVVKKDKSVTRFRAVPGASESDTSLKTETCLIVRPDDTILTFVETAGSLVPYQEGTGAESTGTENTGP